MSSQGQKPSLTCLSDVKITLILHAYTLLTLCNTHIVAGFYTSACKRKEKSLRSIETYLSYILHTLTHTHTHTHTHITYMNTCMYIYK